MYKSKDKFIKLVIYKLILNIYAIDKVRTFHINKILRYDLFNGKIIHILQCYK